MLKILQHIVILLLLLAGLAFPIIWVPVLIWALLMSNLPSPTKRSKSTYKSKHEPKPSSTSYTKPTPIEPIPSKPTPLDYDPDKIQYHSKQDYLKSPAWQTRRKAILKRDNYTCQKCNTNQVPLEVHHLHYRNFTEEPLSDLVSLCRSCHQSIHDNHGYDFYGTFPLN
jgi:5-methylcytosine-specific restriction endonuclease McrA